PDRAHPAPLCEQFVTRAPGLGGAATVTATLPGAAGARRSSRRPRLTSPGGRNPIVRRPFARRSRLLLALLAVLAVFAAACGGEDDDAGSGGDSGSGDSGPLKAAFIFVGPINDGGWTQAHNEGRLYVEEQLGDAVETTYKESVPEGPEARQVIEDLIKDGNQIIFVTSFGFGEAALELAEKYPDVYFEHATGVETRDNVATYFGASEDTIYL